MTAFLDMYNHDVSGVTAALFAFESASASVDDAGGFDVDFLSLIVSDISRPRFDCANFVFPGTATSQVPKEDDTGGVGFPELGSVLLLLSELMFILIVRSSTSGGDSWSSCAIVAGYQICRSYAWSSDNVRYDW